MCDITKSGPWVISIPVWRTTIWWSVRWFYGLSYQKIFFKYLFIVKASVNSALYTNVFWVWTALIYIVQCTCWVVWRQQYQFHPNLSSLYFNFGCLLVNTKAEQFHFFFDTMYSVGILYSVLLLSAYWYVNSISYSINYYWKLTYIM